MITCSRWRTLRTALPVLHFWVVSTSMSEFKTDTQGAVSKTPYTIVYHSLSRHRANATPRQPTSHRWEHADHPILSCQHDNIAGPGTAEAMFPESDPAAAGGTGCPADGDHSADRTAGPRPARLVRSDRVGRGACHLQERPNGGAVSRREPAYAGSPSWLLYRDRPAGGLRPRAGTPR